jgi:hypothetical protein
MLTAVWTRRPKAEQASLQRSHVTATAWVLSDAQEQYRVVDRVNLSPVRCAFPCLLAPWARIIIVHSLLAQYISPKHLPP